MNKKSSLLKQSGQVLHPFDRRPPHYQGEALQLTYYPNGTLYDIFVKFFLNIMNQTEVFSNC